MFIRYMLNENIVYVLREEDVKGVLNRMWKFYHVEDIRPHYNRTCRKLPRWNLCTLRHGFDLGIGRD